MVGAAAGLGGCRAQVVSYAFTGEGHLLAFGLDLAITGRGKGPEDVRCPISDLPFGREYPQQTDKRGLNLKYLKE